MKKPLPAILTPHHLVHRNSKKVANKPLFLEYLAERCNCIASSAISILSVCLSVCRHLSYMTRVYCDKTAEAMIM